MRTRWAWSGSKAGPTNSRCLRERRGSCATASLVKAEPELRRARSSKGPRRPSGKRALPEALQEAMMPEVVEEVLEVVEPGNLNRGYQRVKSQQRGARG